MVSNGDAPAGPELILPSVYEEYALPYEKQVVDGAHKLYKLCKTYLFYFTWNQDPTNCIAYYPNVVTP